MSLVESWLTLLLVFCLIHFWRLKRGATIIGQNSERQGGPSCYCGKHWEAWAVMAAKVLPPRLYGMATRSTHCPATPPLTALPCPLASSHTGLRALLQTHQAPERFSTSVLAALLGAPFGYTSAHFPLLLSSMNSDVTKAVPHTSLYQNNPTGHFLAPLLWFSPVHLWLVDISEEWIFTTLCSSNYNVNSKPEISF